MFFSDFVCVSPANPLPVTVFSVFNSLFFLFWRQLSVLPLQKLSWWQLSVSPLCNRSSHIVGIIFALYPMSALDESPLFVSAFSWRGDEFFCGILDSSVNLSAQNNSGCKIQGLQNTGLFIPEVWWDKGGGGFFCAPLMSVGQVVPFVEFCKLGGSSPEMRHVTHVTGCSWHPCENSLHLKCVVGP